MFSPRSFRISVLVACVLFIGITGIEAQIVDTAKTVLKQRAMELYEKEEYSLALSDFRLLMDEYPRDPMYKYYCGICIVEENRDYEEAIELLHFSSSRGVPADVYYYIGEAYKRMYDFEKAKQYFIRFDREAPRSLARKLNSKQLIRAVDNASLLTMEYNPFELITVTSMNLFDPEQYGQVKMKGGVMQKKPEVLFTGNEDPDDLNALMFMPEKVSRGEYIYFTSYEKNGRNGSQIFRARKGNTGKWTDIRSLDELNSEHNEILPYYDPVSKDIYFASDRYEGIGGFDLYRAHYDEERKEWSEPLNLGFPINSVFDDYLLLPGKDLGLVMFFSGRSGTDSSFAVYRVHFSEPKLSLASADPEEIERIANLGAGTEEAVEELTARQLARESGEESKVSIRSEASGTQKTEVLKPRANFTADNKYQLLVAEALRHQSVSDSLTELATRARVKVRESEDPNDRWLYQKQIMVWEKKASGEQERADKLYAELASFKAGNKTTPSAIVEDTVINEIKVYRFNDMIAGEEISSEKDAEEEQNDKDIPVNAEVPGKRISEERESTRAKEPDLIHRFVKLDASPYSLANPIPVDIELPGGSFYRIQLGAFSKQVSPDAFGGLSPITGETMPERGLTKYYAGKFSRYLDAEQALSVVRSSGFEQAFIVSWYNGNKMSSDKVRKLEK